MKITQFKFEKKGYLFNFKLEKGLKGTVGNLQIQGSWKLCQQFLYHKKEI